MSAWVIATYVCDALTVVLLGCAAWNIHRAHAAQRRAEAILADIRRKSGGAR